MHYGSFNAITIFNFDAENEGEIVLLIDLHVPPFEKIRSLGSLVSLSMFGNGYMQSNRSIHHQQSLYIDKYIAMYVVKQMLTS